MVPRRALLALSLALAALATIPAAAIAIPIPGENGRIVLASGRLSADLDDSTARLFLQPVTFSNSGGPVSAPIVPAGGQYRHPTWSPDRTKIAFANGTADNNPATQNFDIFVIDLEAGTGPVQITPSDGLSADRPSWSPDGTRLAWEHQPVDNDADRIIQVQSTSDLTPPISTTPIPLTDAGGGAEGKPDWSPDAATVYYSHQDGADRDIMREAADNSTVTPVTVLGAGADGVDTWQPAISPFGDEMCYTETGGGDIKKVSLPIPGAAVTISADPVVSEYNCAWSPDGDKIAYVAGATTGGDLMMEESSGLQGFPDGLASDPGNFDGNPDWAPDGRPVCDDQTVTTAVNQPVTFDVECTDTGPTYEQTNVRDFKDTNPTNGTVPFPDQADDPYTYTPNAGFVGTDSFQVQSFDEFGFGTDTGTVTIQVTDDQQPPPPGAKCFGEDATITGTAGNDEIIGTPGDDVIASLSGTDVVRGGGGNDLICGGPQDDRLAGGAGRDRVGGGNGNDRVGGGGGNDRLAGNAGRDRVNGGGGNDSLSGGGQNDRLGGGAGRDRIKGAQGRDRLSGNGGRDRLNGGTGRDRCAGNSGTDTATACERISGIP